MGKGDHLGEFEALVLASVVRVGSDATGVDVYQEIESRTRRDPSVSGVHVTLRRLEQKGLLSSALGDRSPKGGRPQRHYRLTPDGARTLSDFRQMWSRVWRGLEVPDPEAL